MQQTNFRGTAFDVMHRSCGLLIPGNIAAPRRTTCNLVLPAVACLLFVFAGHAATIARAADPIIDAPAVDWSVARSVYQQAEQWVKDEEVKRKASERPLLVSGVIGARVTLRYGGLTLGVGDAVSSSRPQEAQDLRELVAAATEIALQNFKEARDRTFNRALRDQAEKEIREGKKPTVRAPAAKPEPIPLVIDLQIGHAATDVLVPDKAAAQSVYFLFAAGYHGLRMRHHQKPESSAIQWPATALSSNLLPDSQIKRLMADVGYQADEMLQLEPRVGRDKGPRLQRFDAIHITRASENQPITQLTRGNEVIPPQAIDLRTVESMGRRLTGHLVQRLLPDGSLTGTYLPASDLFDPTKATDVDAALVALAMTRRVTMLGGRDPNALEYLNTREKAFVLVDTLRRKFSVQDAKSIEPDAHALLLLAICDAPHLAELRDDRDRLAARLAAIPVDKGLFLNVRRAPLPWETQGMLLAATAALYEKNQDEKLATVIEAGLEAVWSAKLSLTEAVAAMPWIMDATARMHRHTNPGDGKHAAAWKARATAAGELLALLRGKRLVRGKPALGPDDVVGGYDLINETGDGVPTPDWRTAYVLTLLSQSLQAPDVLAGESTNLAKFDATLNVRFLSQLMFDEQSLFYIRGKGREAIDGVRFALWDNRLAVKPTAITLIAVTQLQQSLK